MKARIRGTIQWVLLAAGLSPALGVFADAGGRTPSVQFDYEPGSVWLQAAPFDRTQHQLGECGPRWICTVDGLPFFGTDGDVPSSQLITLDVLLGDTRVALEVSGMFDPWIDRPVKEQFSLTRYAEGLWVLRGRFSDGAAAYHGQWLITKKGAIPTQLGPSELLCDLCLPAITGYVQEQCNQ